MISQEHFKPTISTPDRSWSGRLAKGFLIAVLSLFVGLPILSLVISALMDFALYHAVLFLFLFGLVAILWLKQRNAYTHLKVDKERVHYIHKLRQKTIRTVRWDDLMQSPTNDYDIYPKLKYVVSPQFFTASPCLVWHELRNGKRVEHWENFGSRHILYLFMDTKAMRQAFVEGVKRCRPDLRIHPDA